MRYLILSDIHANLEALDAVMKYATAIDYDQIIVLGDVLDYGPNPKEVLDLLVRLKPKLVLMGNHDYAVLKNRNDAWAHWTYSQLSPRYLGIIDSFEFSPVFFSERLVFLHTSFGDNCRYMTTPADFEEAFTGLQTHICFFGHTHFQILVAQLNEEVRIDCVSTSERLIQLCSNECCLINPGSVGQPRDGKSQAAFAIYDSRKDRILFFRTAYDYETTAQKFADLRLPGMMEKRIREGK